MEGHLKFRLQSHQTEVTLITQYLRILEIVESVNKKEIIDSPVNTAAMKKKKIE